MALDPVPFVIGGDAEHGPSVFRQQVYASTGGRQGVGGPGELKVAALDVPGGGVKVAAGTATILNRVSPFEAYSVRNPVTDTSSVKFSATGSSGGRSDLVVARVDNPYVDGNAQAPADPVHGPYDSFAVIPGVPAGTTRLADLPQYAGVSAVELARVDIPANTGTVTSAMIKDLRSMANPRSSRQVLFGSADPGNNLTSSSFTAWPTTNTYTVDVPPWATHLIARLEFTGGQTAAQAAGSLRLILGSSTAFGEYEYNYAAQNGQARQQVVVAGELKLPTEVKGTTTSLRISGLRSGGTGYLFTVDKTYYLADVQFVERIS